MLNNGIVYISTMDMICDSSDFVERFHKPKLQPNRKKILI